LVDKNIQVIGLVTDRAKALIKLAKPEYLSTFSMPDLFHFMQDYSKAVGSRLGAEVAKVKKKLQKIDCKSVDYEPLKEDLHHKVDRNNQYQQARQQINKQIHPFNEFDQLVCCEKLEIDLRHLFTDIKSIAQKANISITTDQANKILNQIPDLAGGVQHWQDYLNVEIEKLNLKQEHKTWLLETLLPYAYWQFNLSKISSKHRDKELKQYYKQRLEFSELKYKTLSKGFSIQESEKQELIDWAVKIVSSFQRASSRVEGRNGYLAFINHANKGIPKQRKKILTIIHNFDIRNANRSTPAERLFDRDFPNLFEFILNDLGKLPASRARTMKTLAKH